VCPALVAGSHEEWYSLLMFYDVIIIGAGAAGLMCAAQAGKRGRRVLLVDHAKKVGEKIRISGGGRCNFTNIHASPANYISQNPRFCVSALSRYTPKDFIALVESYGIAYHEKTLGQLFCDGSAQQIITMLVKECEKVGVVIQYETEVATVLPSPNPLPEGEGYNFMLETSRGTYQSHALVIATGGVSIPKMGATDFGYRIARQFGLKVIEPRPALVPFTLEDIGLPALAGVAVDAVVHCNTMQFREAILFTHRGLSGPAILQISSYWNPGDSITLNLLPELDLFALLKSRKAAQPKQEIQTVLAEYLPKRLVQHWCAAYRFAGKLADLSHKQLEIVARQINHWQITPSGTEGFRTAEVTSGGVDTDELSSKTLEARKVKGLYFIGEVVDVTGHLGGFNFQWAWASGHAAGGVA
jgi:predicted Rossmann fold flavoprotein